MKLKLWSGLLAAVLALSALASMMIPAAADAPVTGDIWSVYTLTEDDKGLPSYGVIPNYRYTDDGLFVEPVVSKDFTVQTDHAYSLSEGLFMEIRVEDPETFRNHNQLVFHLWDQTGVIVGYDRAGSGFYGLISAVSGEHYLICMGIGEKVGNEDATSVLFGAVKVQPRYTSDGALVYTMSVRDGGVFFNGEKLDMSAKILAFLKSVDPDGAMHAGATVCCREGDPSSAVTLTRFGRKESTAAIPGKDTAPDIPPADTGTGDEPAPETKPSEDPSDPTDPSDPSDPADPSDKPLDPVETTAPPEDGTDKGPEPSVTDPGDKDTQGSVGDGKPDEPRPDESKPDASKPDDGNTGGDGADSGLVTDENGVEVPGGMAQDVVDLFEKVELLSGCESAVGLGGGAAVMAMLAAAVLGRRKQD